MSSNKVHLDLDAELYGDTHTDPFLQDEEKLPINELITRILFERKSFLNVTEESLKEEILGNPSTITEPLGLEQSELSLPAISIDSPEQSIENNLLPTPTEEEEDQPISKFDQFQQQKQELAAHIGSALNETSLSLDFVSLLISAVKPNVGKATMSPHLHKNIPLGSLSADRLQPGEEDQPKSTNCNKIGYGWKYQTLGSVTNLFRTASTTLNEQILKERKYWSMISTVLDNDEVLFKTRDPLTGSKAIGVKYGYGDSGSSYYDQGAGVLRKDEQTGEISFSPLIGHHRNFKLTSKVYKYARVKILSKIDDDYMLTGQSVFDSDKIISGADKVVNDIEKARFFLFEEDLLYYLTREAKSLINYNVSIISNKIIIEINDEIIEIESVVYDENNDDELSNAYQNINKSSSLNNAKAQAILTFLKLMLCCYYNYNLNLKQKIPTSLTKWKQHNTHPLILRPLLGHINHQINITTVHNSLESNLKKFDPERLQYTLEVSKYPHIDNQVEVRNAFQKSIEKPYSRIDVVLENLANKRVMKIEIEVTATEVFANLVIHLNVIKYETMQNYKDNQLGVNSLRLTLNDFADTDECLTWTIRNFLKD